MNAIAEAPTGRVPPHDLVTERAVLACVLLDNAALDEIADILEPLDFYSRANEATFAVMLDLHRKQQPIDFVTVRASLVDRGWLERAGGDDALHAAVESMPTIANVEHHARRIRGLSSVRHTIAAAHRIAADGYAGVEDFDAYLADAETAIARAASVRATPGGPVALKDCVISAFESLTEQAEGKGAALKTRFKAVDLKLGGGARAGQLILVAGRPGMGKTAIGLDLALSLVEQGPGIFYSLEMSRAELVFRAIANEGRIDGGRIRTGMLTREDWTRATSVSGTLANAAMWIDDTAAASLAHIRSTARRHKAKHGLSWIVVDYLQLCGLPGRTQREQEIGDVSRGLKALAKELGAAVVALSQLNRDVEKRPVKDRRPQLSDLRDSGALEQDADVVAFIHREELYQRDNLEVRGLAELIIGKQRNGPIGTVHMRYLHEYTRFEEVLSDEAERAHTNEQADRQNNYRYSGGAAPERAYTPDDFQDD